MSNVSAQDVMVTFLTENWYVILGTAAFAAVLLFVNRFRRVHAKEIAEGATSDIPMELPTVWELAVFGTVAVVYYYNHLAGLRAAGIVLIGFGAWTMKTRRVPYGIEGHKPVGNITGGLAVVLGVLEVGIGCFLMLLPGLFNDIFLHTA